MNVRSTSGLSESIVKASFKIDIQLVFHHIAVVMRCYGRMIGNATADTPWRFTTKIIGTEP